MGRNRKARAVKMKVLNQSPFHDASDRLVSVAYRSLYMRIAVLDNVAESLKRGNEWRKTRLYDQYLHPAADLDHGAVTMRQNLLNQYWNDEMRERNYDAQVIQDKWIAYDQDLEKAYRHGRRFKLQIDLGAYNV